jgi:hypothetical protein
MNSCDVRVFAPAVANTSVPVALGDAVVTVRNRQHICVWLFSIHFTYFKPTLKALLLLKVTA